MSTHGWLTPQNAPPDKFFVRVLFIPNDRDYIGIVNGALSELCNAYNFEAFGAQTPQQTADTFAVMYDKYLRQAKEPPAWTDDEDVDGSDDQPWYDNLADWIIEGFLAITGFPQAAIVYSTSVPKIRVAIRKHDLGALFKVLLNNIEIYTGDSYDAIKQLFGFTLDLQGAATAHSLGPPPWTLKIVHNGPGANLPEGQNGTLAVVRKKWTDEMPIQFRQSDPCLIEYSEDGGSTWATVADLTECQAPSLPTGAMIPLATSTVPTGFLLCDGSAVSRTTYAALFAVIGVTWGSGNGTTTFNLPDTRSRDIVGAGQGSGLTNRVIAATGGEETHALSTGELASHNHQENLGIRSNTSGAVPQKAYYHVGDGGNSFKSIGELALSVNTASPEALNTENAGSGTAHNNMQPFLVAPYIIKT